MQFQRNRIFCYVSLCIVLTINAPVGSNAQPAPTPSIVGSGRDEAHDFDWDYGTWKTHQRRLLHPLTGSTTWVQYSGTDVVSKIWDGANSAKIEADGPAGHLEIYSIRMYNPDAHQWSVYFSNPSGGTLSSPVVGEFTGNGAQFYDQEPYRGRMIMVRFQISEVTKTSCHFDQSFSADGGKTWETNFIVTETLMKPSN